MSDALAACYVIAVGFVAAGLVGSFYQWMTTEPVGFRVADGGLVKGVGSIILCMFAGPFILMRNAARARANRELQTGWFLGAVGIVAYWSFCSGVILLQLALAVRNSVV